MSMYWEMKRTAMRSFTNWTRSTDDLPMHRLKPLRKFNWWCRGMYEIMANRVS